MADVLDTIPAQLEIVKTDLELIFEQSDQIAGRVKKSAKVQQISRYLWRLPFKQFNGGNFSKFSGNGGSLGNGTSMKLSNLNAGYFYSILMFQLNQEQLDTSQNTSQSVINVLSDTLANAMIEASVLDDIAFHQTGTGILTNSSSAITNSVNATMTFAATTDLLGVNMLREGMCISVWDTTGATERVAGTAAPIIITSIDYDNRVVTFNQTVTSLTQGDIISFRGMATYGPATLTSFASGYPGTVGALSGGIGGDSFRHGFRYMTDTTASNYFYGKQKSAFGTQLQAVRVNAQNQPLEWDHFHRIIAKLIQKRGGNSTGPLSPHKKLRGIINPAQRAALMNLGTAISTVLVTGTQFGPSKDLGPTNVDYEDEISAFGIPMDVSKRQDRSRIDFLNYDKLHRAQLFDTQYYDVGGRTVFEGRGSDGTIQAYIQFGVKQAYDFVASDNGCFAVVDSLALPQNWDA